MDEALQEIQRLLADAWRHRKAGLIVAWIVGLVGIAAVAVQKDIYEASTRVYVDTASQLRNLLGDQVIESNVEEQLRFVREAILGRPQLERVAKETGLLAADADIVTVNEAVISLANNLEIVSDSDLAPRAWNSQRTDDTYLLRFENNDREVAIEVVDHLLSIFVEDTLGAKHTSSRVAGDFLMAQIEEYEGRLEKAEAALADFNRRNFDKLPNLQGGYFESLQLAQEQLNESERMLSLARSRLDSIEQQARGETPRMSARLELDPNSLEARLIEAERVLNDLRVRFTDRHPDVIAAREILNNLRKQKADLSGGSDSLLDEASNNPVFQALQISRNEVRAEIDGLLAERSLRSRRVRDLEGLIGEMPEVEAELARLTRDYDVIREKYEALVNSLERENLSREVLESETMEFRVIDPPSAPLDPVAPRRMMLMGIVLVLALGAGAATSYLLSQFKPVFGSLDSLQARTSLPVIGAISATSTGTAEMKNTDSTAFFLLLAGALMAILLSVTVFESMGPGLRSLF